MHENTTTLTYGEKSLVDDVRFRVERPETNIWNLVIAYVRRADGAKYICLVMDSKTYHVTGAHVQLNVINASFV